MGGRGSGGPVGGNVIGQVRELTLDAVGRWQSGNISGLTVAEEYHQKEILGHYTSNDYEVARSHGYKHPRDYQAALTRNIKENGMINAAQWGGEPDGKMLVEGYHRYAAMRQLGRKTMRVKRSY